MSITFYSQNTAFVEKCTEPFFSKPGKNTPVMQSTLKTLLSNFWKISIFTHKYAKRQSQKAKQSD